MRGNEVEESEGRNRPRAELETHSRDGSRDDRKYGSEVAEMVAEMIGSNRDDLKNK